MIMHLYETHLPVKSTEASQRFYVEVVGLEFAYRDLSKFIRSFSNDFIETLKRNSSAMIGQSLKWRWW